MASLFQKRSVANPSIGGNFVQDWQGVQPSRRWTTSFRVPTRILLPTRNLSIGYAQCAGT